jgi:hypothetical protein
MTLVRAWSAALVFLLCIVPAATRAGQHIDVSHRPSQTSGFHKSVDVPPDPFVVPPDRTRRLLDVLHAAPPIRVAPPSDEPLPVSAVVVGADSLRAPPVHPV